MKIEIDDELGLQHSSNALRNVKLWSRRSDNLKLIDNVEIENKNIASLSEDLGLCIAMNNRHDTGLEPFQELFPPAHNDITDVPPTEQILSTRIQPELREKVVITHNDDHPTRLMDITNKDMDMDIKLEAGKYGDMSRKRLLCPICNSNCPSRRFLEFPLRKKDQGPTPLPFQDNIKPPPPETPKLMQKIHKCIVKTPQVKRKALEDLEFLEQEKQKAPAPHTPPPPPVQIGLILKITPL